MIGARFHRVGLVVNCAAGQGPAAALRAAARAIAALRAREVVTGPGELGAAALSGLDLDVEVRAVEPAHGPAATRALARALLHTTPGHDLGAVVVVGGDGTMADVAGEILDAGRRPPVLGVGCGSLNRGALVTCPAVAVEGLRPDQLRPARVDALLAQAGDRCAVAFNDCVIGTTVVGTRDGALVDLDAAALLSGRRDPGRPQPVGAAGASVRVGGPYGERLLAEGTAVGTVVVGFAERGFFGKAATGGICLAAHAGLPAGCLVADRPLARVDLTAATLLAGTPIRTVFAALGPTSTVMARGVRPGAVLCADGNPVALLSAATTATVTVRPAALTALTLPGGPR